MPKHPTLSAALLAAQKACKRLRRNAIAEDGYRYADLDTVVSEAHRVLWEQGLAVGHFPGPISQVGATYVVELVTTISHADTEKALSAKSHMPLESLDAKAVSAALSNGRRLALIHMLGMRHQREKAPQRPSQWEAVEGELTKLSAKDLKAVRHAFLRLTSAQAIVVLRQHADPSAIIAEAKRIAGEKP